MSDRTMSLTDKLNIWEEILDYLDRLFTYALHHGAGRQEHCLDLKYVDYHDLNAEIHHSLRRSGCHYDEHGAMLEQLIRWSSKSWRRTPAAKLYDQVYHAMYQILRQVVKKIFREMKVIKREVKTDKELEAVEVFKELLKDCRQTWG